MSDLLESIKADLSNKRMLALLVALALALLAALAYALFGGGEVAKPTSAVRVPLSVPPIPGPTVSTAPANPHAAIAETTNGGRFQHQGPFHDPFAPQPGGGEGTSASQSGTGGSGESGSSGSGASGSSPSSQAGAGEGSGAANAPGGGSEAGPRSGNSGSSGGEAGNGESGKGKSGSGSGKSSVAPYAVNVTLQRLSAAGASTGQPVKVENIKRDEVLPSAKRALLAFLGVVEGGDGVVFVLLQPPILDGAGRCLPGPNNCKALFLPPSSSEELQYLLPGGREVAYKLHVGAVRPTGGGTNADAATSSRDHAPSRAAGRALSGVSARGAKILSALRLPAVPGIRFSARLQALAGVHAALAKAKPSLQRAPAGM